MSRTMRNVLITRFSALGDVAMCVPVVYSVCRSNPGISFFMVTRKVPAQVFVNAHDNLSVIPVDLGDYKGVGGLWRLHNELRLKYAIDAFADLHDVLRSKILRVFMRLRGVKVARIHKGRSGKRALTRSSRKVMLPLTSSRARYREVFWRLGLSRDDVFRHLFESAEPSPEVYAAATPPKKNGETWIAIAPFAMHPGKIYPLRLMEQIVAALASRDGYRLFLFGAGDSECATIARWCDSYGENLVNMAELRLGIPVELALLRHCDLMLSMDSANMHLASLVSLRVVSIWGATHPYCGFMGWNQRREDTVQLDMVCRPCSVYGNKPCMRGDLHCLNGIPPTLVLGRIDSVLSERGR